MEKSVESGGSTAAVKTTSKMVHFEASFLASLREVYDHLHEKGLSDDQTHLETADFSAFLAAMADASSNIMLPAPPSSLDRPLSAYFISASHNTYLTGHQLYGSATVDGYKTVRLICDCLWSGDEVTPWCRHPTNHLRFCFKAVVASKSTAGMASSHPATSKGRDQPLRTARSASHSPSCCTVSTACRPGARDWVD